MVCEKRVSGKQRRNVMDCFPGSGVDIIHELLEVQSFSVSPVFDEFLLCFISANISN